MNEILQMAQAVGFGVILLFPLANPLTSVALFLGLSTRMSKKERNRQAYLAAIYVFFIMFVSFFGGQLVMTTFGISIPGLRIAGGLIVTLLGFKMLFPSQSDSPLVVDDKKDELKYNPATNIAFVPLAMPGTAGPGTIAMIISTAASISQERNVFSWTYIVAPIIVFLIVSLTLWIALRSSEAIMKLMGQSGVDAASRLMGFLLVCMGTQFVIYGIQDIISTYIH